jgi:Rrf2 family protein
MQIKVIGQRQAISVKYLEQLMAILKSGGFVHSVRGSRGGYVLSREPGQVRLDELVLALEGTITAAECVDDNGYCARAADCVARELWTRVQHAVMDVLGSLTLKDLVDKTKSQCNALSYQI